MFKQIRRNKLRTALFMAVFLLSFLLLAAGLSLLLRNYAVGAAILTAAVVYGVVQYLNSTNTAIYLLRAKPADPETYKELHSIVSTLSIRTGISKPKVYIIRRSGPNAFAAGLKPEKAIIGVTTGLLKIMDKNELEGVLAHEISHIQNYDTLLRTVTTSVNAIVLILVSIVKAVNKSLRSARRSSRTLNLFDIPLPRLRSLPLISLIMLIPTILIVWIASPLLKLSQALISREREFLADMSSAEITRYPEGLASALVKIGDWDSSNIVLTEATNNLHFASPNPLPGFLSRTLATHPPTWERIARLRGLDSI